MQKIKTLFASIVPLFLAFALQFAVAYFLLFLAGIFLFVIAPALGNNSYDIDDLLTLALNQDFNTAISIVFSLSCILFFATWYYKKLRGRFKLDIKTEFHPYEILGLLFLVPGTQFMSSIVTGTISMIFPKWLEDYLALIENAGLTGEISPLMLMYTVFLAPIGEELIFRGVTFGILRKAFPFWVANIIQALLFGIFHLNPLQGCYTFFVGLFMGYICEKGGTLYHAILFHLLFNLWGATASQWLLLGNETTQALIIAFGTIIGLRAGLHLFKKGNTLK